MDFLLDDPATEKTFQEIIAKVRLRKNGETVAQMKSMGLNYKMNWGVSVIHLRELAKNYEKNHLLALKLWNKGWRETMILATLLEEPNVVTEEQMDYWTKSIETIELIEQAVANLFVHSKFAFVKAVEYCCGKKHLVRCAGLQLIGRLALVDKKAINEMFEPFFEKLVPLAKDPELGQIFYRTVLLMANRNAELRQSCIDFLGLVKEMEEEHPKNLANLLLEDIAEMDSGTPEL
ncbi:DNA alkylation repair protein [Mangrovibacterium sp.]|uniref:DNA alkylation repair protein n=1 Tax=Mangrovibacterium sp. TaxID=1961364 RepID=UPI0035629661